MKKVFISQPMNGRPIKEIKKEREEILEKVADKLQEDVLPLLSLFDKFDLVYDSYGNIIMPFIPEYNIITEDDSLMVKAEKQKAQKNQFIDWNDHIENASPLWFLSKSLEVMSLADVVVFANNWEKYRGCKIEHQCAKEYGLEIIYFNNDDI